MEIGHFYYIDDQYFKDFPDPYLMQNKEKVNGQLHDRLVLCQDLVQVKMRNFSPF